MYNSIKELIESLRNNILKKGYPYLAGVITRKRNEFLVEVNEENLTQTDREIKAKELLTNVLTIIYQHVKEGEKKAKAELELIDSISKFFLEFEFEEQNLVVDYGSKQTSLQSTRSKYEEFYDIRAGLIEFISYLQIKGYLKQNYEMEQILNENRN